MTDLHEKLQTGSKVFTAEITPPKGAGIKKLVKNAEILRGCVDALNVTDCQRALVRMSSLAACRVLADHSFETVLQVTCRDRNSIALQADLMGASALGIRNLLCLTGDPVKAGDNPTAKSVFEFESVRLLELVAKLQTGTDGSDHKMNAATKFFVGAVVNPSLISAASQLNRMEKKIGAGARFFQSQANYDLDDFPNFLDKARPMGAYLLPGILILHSREIAKHIHENIPGIRIPDSVLRRFEKCADPREEGIELAVETMIAVDRVSDGFHLMSIRAEELIPEVLKRYHERVRTTKNAAL